MNNTIITNNAQNKAVGKHTGCRAQAQENVIS